MQKQEFEEITGIKTTDKEYALIEQIYLNTELEKNEFCNDYMHGNGREIQRELLNNIDDLRSHINKLDNKILELQQEREDMVDFIISMYNRTGERLLRQQAIAMVGEKKYLLRRLYMEHSMDEEDRQSLIMILESK